MSRDILQQICLEFSKEKKQEVLDLLKKDDYLESGKIREQGEDYLIIEIYNRDIEESNFEEYKKICTYISFGEFEAIDETSFIWEKE